MNQADDLTDYSSLSLAGLFQAAELVHGRAHARMCSADALKAVKAAITTQHAQSLRDVFARPRDLMDGVKSARAALSGNPSSPEVLRYALQLVDLSGRLGKSERVLERLGAGLDALGSEPTDSEFAEVYKDTISTLGKRIEVTGDMSQLNQNEVADEIRSLLLGGIRFAWLWRQLGGRRWHLIMRRNPILIALQGLEHTLEYSLDNRS